MSRKHVNRQWFCTFGTMGAASFFLGLNCFVYAFNRHNNEFKVGLKGLQ
jgi:hypothetical protein